MLKFKGKSLGRTRLGEGLVATWLAEHGWSPHRTSPKDDSGIPDFECSNNRWVEAKNLSYGHLDIALCQINYWRRLLGQGEKVFLVLYDSKKEVIGTPPLDISVITLSDVAELVNIVMETNVKEEMKKIIDKSAQVAKG